MNKVVIKQILKSITHELAEEQDYLVELDGKMGDGDLGLTMVKGFNSLYDEVDYIVADDLGTILLRLGMKMNTTVPSTMGSLISICLLKSAAVVKGKTTCSLADMARMGRAALDGVMERGQAQVGEKTMLDALHPAVVILESFASQGKEADEALPLAYQAAKDGMERTKHLVSIHGRAGYYKEKTLGMPDAGAVAVTLIFKGICLALFSEENIFQ